ncbi:hypothetical protein [Sutcliffiella horikoshii]|uniref:hypothetical protein n=1 Tax=Sutcliffiella horikoshii TaxID=79883 RepID=UPI001CC101AF|nr:hypothetical protein [Sutcliffiella horikoshii]UAL45574.1 hypothetical protein K7887_11470 [Sutcliffiella horikoshii]
MNDYDMEKVRASLHYFRHELKVLLDLLESYEISDYEQKAKLQEDLIIRFKRYKEKLKREIKILIEYDANLLSSDFLLPSLAVAFAYLQDIGVNRINPNSIQKVVQQIKKAYFFMERCDQNINTGT